MIKYLSNDEKYLTRKIWEKIFKEDTKQFLDYYYKYKNIDNKLLCKYIDNKIVSMLHLNPYNIFINGKSYLSYYIVAVATLTEYRKRGFMSEILKKSLNDMYKQNIPFTFLRPAKKEIYLPFDFEYIYNHNYLDLKNNNLIEKSICKDDYESIANFTNKFLSERYNTFCIRDYNYIKVLHNEVKSENGDIIKLFNNNKFIGYYIYWGIKEKIVRAIFLDDNFINIKENKPLVMARIVNIYEFFKCFFLKNSNTEKVTLYISINDNIIKENNNIFKLNVYKDKSNLELTNTNYEYENILNIDIKDLLSVFFGYKDIRNFTNNQSIIDDIYKINLLDKSFIDEEV